MRFTERTGALRDIFHDKPDYTLAAVWLAIKDRQGRQWWMTASDYDELGKEEREAASKEKTKLKRKSA